MNRRNFLAASASMAAASAIPLAPMPAPSVAATAAIATKPTTVVTMMSTLGINVGDVLIAHGVNGLTDEEYTVASVSRHEVGLTSQTGLGT